jgi:hypothetical protein
VTQRFFSKEKKENYHREHCYKNCRKLQKEINLGWCTEGSRSKFFQRIQT